LIVYVIIIYTNNNNNQQRENEMTNKNISIDKLDLASCINLNIRNQKGWVAVEWCPSKGHSKVIGIARTKRELLEELANR
tara:strand:- start:555 stop:794 length:240 start_codon:yes stop_codon:yes gene_type:complete